MTVWLCCSSLVAFWISSYLTHLSSCLCGIIAQWDLSASVSYKLTADQQQHTWTCCEIVGLGHGSGSVFAAGFLNASCFLRWSVSWIGSWSACSEKLPSDPLQTTTSQSARQSSPVLTCALSEIWTSSSSIWTSYETECAFCFLCLQNTSINGKNCWVNKTQRCLYILPGSMAAEMRDWASLTLFMASSISLLELSALRLALRFNPAAKGFSLNNNTFVK